MPPRPPGGPTQSRSPDGRTHSRSPGGRDRSRSSGSEDRPRAPGHEEDDLGDPEAVARVLCLRQLDVRARTRDELARYLARKGVPEDPANRVLDRFVEVGLIDDRALAASYVIAGHADQGLARRALSAKLRQRGVADEVAAEAVGQLDQHAEAVRARALVERKLRSMAGLEPEAARRRLVGLLGRKGYPSGLAYAVVREALRSPEWEIPSV